MLSLRLYTNLSLQFLSSLGLSQGFIIGARGRGYGDGVILVETTSKPPVAQRAGGIYERRFPILGRQILSIVYIY